MQQVSLQFLLCIVLLILYPCNPKPKESDLPFPNANKPFSEFKVLSIPKSDISIGSLWKQGIGPTEDVPNTDLLLIRSGLDSMLLSQNKNLQLGITSLIANKFGINFNRKNKSKYNLSLGGMEIIRVGNLDSLSSFEAGKHYLWEGIKLKNFSFIDSKQREGDIRATIPSSKVEIELEATDSSKYKYMVTGADLFVAYRVIKMETGDKIEFPMQKPVRGVLHTNYILDLDDSYTIVIMGTDEDTGSYAEYTLTDNSVLIDNKPKIFNGKIFKPNKFKDVSFEKSSRFLQIKQSENGFKLDNLSFNLTLKNIDKEVPFYEGIIKIVRRNLLIKPFPEAYADGW